jgi:hypothetical protein
VAIEREGRVKTIGDLPDWLQAKIRTQTQAWTDGTVRVCTHDPRPGAPVYMVAWKPELVTCPQCTHLLLVVTDHDQANRCDCCRRVTAGTEEDHTYGAQATLGALTYSFAACSACRTAMS